MPGSETSKIFMNEAGGLLTSVYGPGLDEGPGVPMTTILPLSMNISLMLSSWAKSVRDTTLACSAG